MRDLNANFTFRLSDEDKTALAELAGRMGCDRGEVLRRLIRSSHQIAPGESGHFVAHGQALRLKLQVSERAE